MRKPTTKEEQAERQTNIRRVQTEMLVLQSDKNRLKHKHDDLLAEIHSLQNELTHLKASLAEKETEARSVAREIEIANEAIANAQRHMNAL